jgi:hypothetical protein
MIGGSRSLERRKLARGLKVFLDILFYLTLLVAVMLVVSVPVGLFTDYDEGWDLIVPVTVGEGSFFTRSMSLEFQPHPPPEIEWVRLEGQGHLHLFHHNKALALARAGTYLVTFGVILWALVLLRRILAATAGGQPFHPHNPRRLNLLGWIIFCATLLGSLYQYLASRWALSTVEVTSLTLSPHGEFHEGWIVCGLLVLVLAAIWKEAVQIAEEQSLTV